VKDPWQVANPGIVGLQSTMHDEYPMQVGTHPHVGWPSQVCVPGHVKLPAHVY
jgi:hypothetical protein